MSAATYPPVADANRPIVQQIPANGDFIEPMMIQVVVVGFQGNREQIFHAAINSLSPSQNRDTPALTINYSFWPV